MCVTLAASRALNPPLSFQTPCQVFFHNAMTGRVRAFKCMGHTLE